MKNSKGRSLEILIDGKQKILNFALPILLRKNQEIKETVPNPAFAVKILAVNPNKERARN